MSLVTVFNRQHFWMHCLERKFHWNLFPGGPILKKSVLIRCLTDNKWLHEAVLTPRYLTPYVITRPQWLNQQHSSTLKGCNFFKYVLNQNKNVPPFLHSQCYGCWWLGDVRCQGISSYDIDIACTRYSIEGMGRFSTCCDYGHIACLRSRYLKTLQYGVHYIITWYYTKYG